MTRGALSLGSKRVLAGRYELESLIDTGGMGEVWRARHLALKSTVAIKLLHGASATDEAARKRFLVEAQVTATLKTRHAVQVFDFGVTEDGHPYLVMELVEGEPLDRRIAREGKVDAVTVVHILQRAARALDRAHALGIVHRDFKPENVMVCTDEDGGLDVKVVDFGIAKILGELETEHGPPSRGASVVGTPYYMAPEQINDPSGVGPPADVWALGVVAYECLTGRRPFDDPTVPGLMRCVLSAVPVAKASEISTLPALFDDWFATATDKDPALRFGDAGTAVTALAVVLEVPTAAPSAPRREVSKSSMPVTLERRTVDPLSETIDAARASGIRRADASDPAVDDVADTARRRQKSRARLGIAALAITGIVLVGLWVSSSTGAGDRGGRERVSEPAAVASPTAANAVVSGAAEPAPAAATAAPTTDEGAAQIAPPASSSSAAPDVPSATPRAPVRGGGVAPRRKVAPTVTASASAPPPAPAAPAVPSKPAAPSPFQLPPLGL